MKEVVRIMLVEDDESLGFLVRDSLESQGWKVDIFTSGEKALTAFHHDVFDLCILDVMLPEKDGFSLATEIRRYNQQVPVIFLTARSQPDDRIRGFKSGADDYVCKPFSIEEFKCRIEAVLKRTAGTGLQSQISTLLTAGNSTLDFHNLTLNVSGEITRLTYKEAKLLQLFFRHAGKLIARELFMKTIWENDGFFVARSMDVFISRLRKYLKNDPVLRIENVRSVGYVLKVLQVSGQ